MTYLTNEQRFALASKMLSIVERMTFGRQASVETRESSTTPQKPSDHLSDEQEEALSAIVRSYVSVAPEVSEEQNG